MEKDLAHSDLPSRRKYHFLRIIAVNCYRYRRDDWSTFDIIAPPYCAVTVVISVTSVIFNRALISSVTSVRD